MTKNDHLSSEDLALVRYVDELLESGGRPATRDNKVHLALFDALIGTIPRARPTFKNRLRADIQLAIFERSLSKRPGTSIRRIMVSSLTLLAVIALLAATPRGRSFAEELIRFFTKGESDSVTEPTVIPLTELTTYASIEDAEIAAGFVARTPANLPPGYELGTVQVDQTEQTIRITYLGPASQTPVMTPLMTITQRKLPFDDLVGPSAEIEELTVGGERGEYIKGGWMYVESSEPGQEKEFHWEETLVPAQSLRWKLDEFYFEISFVGSDTQPGYLGKAALIRIGESLR